jgi:hypothetical protein
MENSLSPFIPAVELAPLLKGSHQDMALRLAEEIEAEKTRFGGAPVHLVATFDSHAIVMSEAGEVYRVAYETANSGKVHLTKQEVLPVTVVTEKTLRRFVQTEAKAAADLFLKGMVTQANAKVAALFPLMDNALAASDDEIIDGFAESRKADRLWKSMLEGRGDQIRSYISENALPAPLAAKFKKLYDGATTPEELPNFKSLVHSDLAGLIGRLSVVEAQAQEALHQLRTVKDAASEEGGSEAIAQLEQYAADLLSDVSEVKEFATEAVRDFNQVDLLAKVFDSMASEVASFEVAGAFASKMASRLAEASR